MAAPSPREAVYSVTSPQLPPPQQPIQINPKYSTLDPRSGPPIDSEVQRSNSTRRRKPSGQNARVEDTIQDEEIPSAPEPPKAPRGLPSTQSFAARAGIAPEQFSPRGPSYDKPDMMNGDRDSRRASRPLSYEPQDIPRSSGEPAYNSVNARKVIYHQRSPSEHQPIGMNGGSYARQATSPEMQASSPATRSKSQRYSTQQQQQYMATEKSPLQKLEMKLGDISKEDKRARMEAAEQKLREKDAPTRRRVVSQSDVPARQSSASKRTVSGPIYQRIADQATGSERRQHQRDIPDLQVDTRPRRQARDSGTPRSSRPVSALTPSSQQTPKRASLDTGRYDDREVRFHNQVEDINGTLDGQVASASITNSALPKMHREDITQGSNIKGFSEPMKADVVPPQAVQKQLDPLDYVIPPQTAAAVEARNQVGFGTDASVQNPELEKHHHHHLSDLLHRRPKETANQSTPARGLDEWKTGGVAILTLADMKAPASQSRSKPSPEDNDYQAWWEQQQQQSGGRSRSNSKAAVDVDQADGYFEDHNGKLSSFLSFFSSFEYKSQRISFFLSIL